MNKKNCYIILIIILCLTQGRVFSQNDIHYSQYYNAPIFTNPALTGQLGEDDFLRFNVLSRQQWTGTAAYETDGYMYQTVQGGVDFNIGKLRRLGTGLGFISDKSGGGIFNTVKILPSASYSFIMRDNILTAGIQSLVNISQLDASKLDPLIVEQFKTSATYFDINAGLNYKHDFRYIIADFGVAATNLIQAKQQFAKGGSGEKVATTYKVYVNLDWDAKEKVRILPGVLGSMQATATNFVFGSNVQYKLLSMGEKGTTIIGGLWFRTNNGNFESVIPKFGTRINKLMIMASYDYNLTFTDTDNTNFFKGLTNTFEISIIFTAKPKVVKELLEDKFILNPRY